MLQSRDEFSRLAKLYFTGDRRTVEETAAAASVSPATILSMRGGERTKRQTIINVAGAYMLDVRQINELLGAAGYEHLLDTFQNKARHLKAKYRSLISNYESALEITIHEAERKVYRRLISQLNEKLRKVEKFEVSYNLAERPVRIQPSTNLEDDPVYALAGEEVKKLMEERRLSNEDYLKHLFTTGAYSALTEPELMQMLKELFYSDKNGYPSNQGVESLVSFLEQGLIDRANPDGP